MGAQRDAIKADVPSEENSRPYAEPEHTLAVPHCHLVLSVKPDKDNSELSLHSYYKLRLN